MFFTILPKRPATRKPTPSPAVREAAGLCPACYGTGIAMVPDPRTGHRRATDCPRGCPKDAMRTIRRFLAGQEGEAA